MKLAKVTDDTLLEDQKISGKYKEGQYGWGILFDPCKKQIQEL